MKANLLWSKYLLYGAKYISDTRISNEVKKRITLLLLKFLKNYKTNNFKFGTQHNQEI